MLSDKHRMDTIRENLNRVRDGITRAPTYTTERQQNDTLYVALLKAKEASVYLLQLDSCPLPKDTILSVLLTMDKLALAMSEEKKDKAIQSASDALDSAWKGLPVIANN